MFFYLQKCRKTRFIEHVDTTDFMVRLYEKLLEERNFWKGGYFFLLCRSEWKFICIHCFGSFTPVREKFSEIFSKCLTASISQFCQKKFVVPFIPQVGWNSLFCHEHWFERKTALTSELDETAVLSFACCALTDTSQKVIMNSQRVFSFCVMGGKRKTKTSLRNPPSEACKRTF